MTRTAYAWLLLATLGACRGQHRAQECFSTDDCGRDEVCFFASCQPSGYAITTVYATLTPPNDSPYLAQPHPAAINLALGRQSLTLRSAVTMQGKVLPVGADIQAESLTGVLRARGAGPLPGMELGHQTSVDVSGYALALVPGVDYRVSFTPDGTASWPSVDYPPQAQPAIVLTSDSTHTIPYPSIDSLVVVRGQVTSDEWTPVSGAQVSAVATAEDGAAPQRALSASTDATGNYRLVFAPGAQRFDVTVAPGDNPLVPELTVPDLVGSSTADPEPSLLLPKISLGNITGTAVVAEVRDAASGTPIANANVLLNGIVGLGRFLTTGTSDANGVVESDSSQLPTGALTVLPGAYTITVAPPKSQPFALTRADIVLPTSAGPLVLAVGRKVHLFGRTLTHAGVPLAQARITMTLRDSAIARSFSAVTDSDGRYSIDVDPGTADAPAGYEVIVEPDRQSGQPRHRVLLHVTDVDAAQDLVLYAPSFAYGRVVDAGNNVVSGVIIAFYSDELGTAQEPLLVGLGESNERGEFAVPLPTPDSD